MKRNECGYTCLIESFEKVTNYCDALNETFIDVSVRPRKEQRLFNSEAFREASVNACVHNKWSENLAPAVYWVKDRSEILPMMIFRESRKNEPANEPANEPENKPIKVSKYAGNRPVNGFANEPVKLMKSMTKVSPFMQSHPDGTIDDIAAVNLSCSTVKHALKTLKDNGYTVRVGSDKIKHWKIKTYKRISR